MGKCRLCGEYAGYFRYHHRDCKEKNHEAHTHLVSRGVDMLHGTSDDVDKGWRVWSDTATAGFLTPEERRRYAIQVLESSLDKCLDDGLLEDQEQDRLTTWMELAEINDDGADIEPHRHKLFRAQMLRQLLNDEPPSLIKVSGDLPVLLQKSEQLFYLFHGVKFHEDRTTTHYEGRSSGVSIRVAKGVYYRTGGFRGHPVKETTMTYIDTGMFLITDKHVYFHGSEKSFRTRIDRIVGLQPYSDGVGVRKDGTTAKAQIFSGLDGWFTYNLIKHLAP